MDSADREVLETAADWLDAGHGVYLVTVARTWGSSPRPPGSLLAVRAADARFVGSGSGGCGGGGLSARRGAPVSPPAKRVCIRRNATPLSVLTERILSRCSARPGACC